jgi:hypothetical protein
MAWQPETLNYGGGVPVRIFPTVKTPKTATLVAIGKNRTWSILSSVASCCRYVCLGMGSLNFAL